MNQGAYEKAAVERVVFETYRCASSTRNSMGKPSVWEARFSASSIMIMLLSTPVTRPACPTYFCKFESHMPHTAPDFENVVSRLRVEGAQLRCVCMTWHDGFVPCLVKSKYSTSERGFL